MSRPSPSRARTRPPPPTLKRMPNGALASIAGNVDAHHDVAIADLVLVQAACGETVERSCASTSPTSSGSR